MTDQSLEDVRRKQAEATLGTNMFEDLAACRHMVLVWRPSNYEEPPRPTPEWVKQEFEMRVDTLIAAASADVEARYAPVAAAIAKAWERFGDESMGGQAMNRAEKHAAMSEEVGEVAREVVTACRNVSGVEPLRHGTFDPAKLIHELDQVAGCAIMWAEMERAALAPKGVERG